MSDHRYLKVTCHGSSLQSLRQKSSWNRNMLWTTPPHPSQFFALYKKFLLLRYQFQSLSNESRKIMSLAAHDGMKNNWFMSGVAQESVHFSSALQCQHYASCFSKSRFPPFLLSRFGPSQLTVVGDTVFCRSVFGNKSGNYARHAYSSLKCDLWFHPQNRENGTFSLTAPSLLT